MVSFNLKYSEVGFIPETRTVSQRRRSRVFSSGPGITQIYLASVLGNEI